jgi:hypothetical protein
MALDPKVKDELVKHIIYKGECVFGLTTSDIRRFAFQIAGTFQIMFIMFSEPPLGGG